MNVKYQKIPMFKENSKQQILKSKAKTHQYNFPLKFTGNSKYRIYLAAILEVIIDSDSIVY